MGKAGSSGAPGWTGRLGSRPTAPPLPPPPPVSSRPRGWAGGGLAPGSFGSSFVLSTYGAWDTLQTLGTYPPTGVSGGHCKAWKEKQILRGGGRDPAEGTLPSSEIQEELKQLDPQG